jgi:hypothetical protein
MAVRRQTAFDPVAQLKKNEQLLDMLVAAGQIRDANSPAMSLVLEDISTRFLGQPQYANVALDNAIRKAGAIGMGPARAQLMSAIPTIAGAAVSQRQASLRPPPALRSRALSASTPEYIAGRGRAFRRPMSGERLKAFRKQYADLKSAGQVSQFAPSRVRRQQSAREQTATTARLAQESDVQRAQRLQLREDRLRRVIERRSNIFGSPATVPQAERVKRLRAVATARTGITPRVRTVAKYAGLAGGAATALGLLGSIFSGGDETKASATKDRASLLFPEDKKANPELVDLNRQLEAKKKEVEIMLLLKRLQEPTTAGSRSGASLNLL